MSLPMEQLEAEALLLPVRERARLAHLLIVSLGEDEDEDPAEVESAWEEEIQRRLDDYHADRTTAISVAEVLAKLRARYDRAP